MRTFAPLRLSILAALGAAGLSGCDSTITDGDGGGGGGTGGGPIEPSVCVDPQPIAQESGGASGFVRCADGAVDRVAAVACEQPLSDGPACQGDEDSQTCTTDSDCVDRPHGRCIHYEDFDASTHCGCSYGCATDDDCTDGRSCVCAGVLDSESSRCVASNCSDSEDCGSGACGLAVWDDGCGAVPSLACRVGGDECRSDGDCASDEDCSPGNPAAAGEAFICRSNNECAIGRPMTIEGHARVAFPRDRLDWASDGRATATTYEPSIRAALAERWATIAAMEHASIGSFARFTVQLLALGAPAELLAATQRAAADEVEHAKLAYALASDFAGRTLGPGPLEGVGAPIPTAEEDVLRSLVIEACIGETLGVAEALATADACADPGIRSVLERIASDEQRHAELAWQTLAWMLSRGEFGPMAERGPILRAVVFAAIRETDALYVEGVDHVVDRPAGLLSSREIVQIRRRAFEEIIRPCLAALGVDDGERTA